MTTVRIEGEGAREIVPAVLELAGRAAASEDEIVSHFAPEAQTSIRALVRELRARRLLLPAGTDAEPVQESPLDVFHWHFVSPDERSPSAPRDEPVTVGGESATAARLRGLLDEAGFRAVFPAREPVLSAGTRVVAAVSELGFAPLRVWNAICLEHEVPFLPVAIVDLVAYVGPLVVPRQTPCFECFLRRRYSNLDQADMREPLELEPRVDRVVALHPGISAVAAGAAALELTRFFLPWQAGSEAGYVRTFNLLGGVFARRRVLKVPRCPCCGSASERPPTAVERIQLDDAAEHG